VKNNETHNYRMSVYFQETCL